MKKITTMLVLAMVLVGLAPFASAENADADSAITPSRLGIHANDSAGVNEDGSDGGPRPMLISAGGERTMLIASLNKTMTRLRQVAAERIDAARENYAQARQRYQEAKQNYADARQKISQSRQRYKECTGNEDAECVQVRKEAKSNAGKMLTSASDRIISSLEKLKERIELSDRMTEEEAQQRIAEIDAKIAEIEASKAAADSLDENSDPAEIRAAAQQLSQSWQNTKQSMKMNAARVVNAKIGGVIVKTEQLSERLRLAVDKLDSQGEDTSELEALIAEFNSDVESAKEHYNLGIAKHNEAAGKQGDVDEIMKEATSEMQDAHSALKEAHAVLARILRQVKMQNGGVEALNEAADELNQTEAGDE